MDTHTHTKVVTFHFQDLSWRFDGRRFNWLFSMVVSSLETCCAHFRGFLSSVRWNIEYVCVCARMHLSCILFLFGTSSSFFLACFLSLSLSLARSFVVLFNCNHVIIYLDARVTRAVRTNYGLTNWNALKFKGKKSFQVLSLVCVCVYFRFYFHFMPFSWNERTLFKKKKFLYALFSSWLRISN